MNYKDSLINDKIYEYEDEVDRLGRKRVWSIVLGLLVGAGAYTAGLLLNPILSSLTIPMMLLGTMGPLAGVYSSETANDLREEYKKRATHLKKMKANGVAKNDAIDQKKEAKLQELNEEQKDVNSSIDADSLIGTVAGVMWLIGAGASAIFQPAMWASIAGLLIFSGACMESEKDEKAFEKLQTRIDNLENDLIYGLPYSYDPEKSHESVQSVKDAKKNKKVKTRNPSYEKQVEEYVENMDKRDEKEVAYQKIK